MINVKQLPINGWWWLLTFQWWFRIQNSKLQTPSINNREPTLLSHCWSAAALPICPTIHFFFTSTSICYLHYLISVLPRWATSVRTRAHHDQSKTGSMRWCCRQSKMVNGKKNWLSWHYARSGDGFESDNKRKVSRPAQNKCHQTGLD